MSALLLTDLVGSVIVIIGAAWGAVRWGRKIARAVSGWVERVGDNTSATKELTATVAEVRDDIKEVVTTLKQHGDQIAVHERRLDEHDRLLGGRKSPGGK